MAFLQFLEVMFHCFLFIFYLEHLSLHVCQINDLRYFFTQEYIYLDNWGHSEELELSIHLYLQSLGSGHNAFSSHRKCY